MTEGEIRDLLERTGDSMLHAVQCLSQLSKSNNPAHQAMIKHTIEIEQRLEKEMTELQTMLDKLKS